MFAAVLSVGLCAIGVNQWRTSWHDASHRWGNAVSMTAGAAVLFGLPLAAVGHFWSWTFASWVCGLVTGSLAIPNRKQHRVAQLLRREEKETVVDWEILEAAEAAVREGSVGRASDLFTLGQSLARTARPMTALEVFKMVSMDELKPRQRAALVAHKCFALMRLKRPQEVLDLLATVDVSNKGFRHQALLLKAGALCLLGQYSDAAERLSEGGGGTPSAAQQFMMAHQAMTTGDEARATEHLNSLGPAMLTRLLAQESVWTMGPAEPLARRISQSASKA